MNISRLPVTPKEALVTSKLTGFLISMVTIFARIFRLWNRPAKNAQTDLKEMNLLHKIYWVYKTEHPITEMESDNPLRKTAAPPDVDFLPEGLKKEKALTLAAVGDLMKVEGLENSQDFLYDHVADLLFENDIIYGNLESQLTTQEIKALVFSEKEGPPLCCTVEQYKASVSHEQRRYTVMHTACNHTLDMGLEGLLTTQKQLDQDGILELGTNRIEGEQKQALILEKNGFRLGFISATFGLNGRDVPDGEDFRVNVSKLHNPKGEVNPEILLTQLSDCREKGCDFVFASLHWGYEYEFFPRTQQVETAHALIEAGADAIIAHHAHVIQPVEVYRTKRDPNRMAVIAYSLGNLTSPFSAAATVLSQILNIRLCKGTFQDSKKTYIESYLATPTIQMERDNNGLPAIQLEKLDEIRNTSVSSDQKAYLDEVADYANLVRGEFRTCVSSK